MRLAACAGDRYCRPEPPDGLPRTRPLGGERRWSRGRARRNQATLAVGDPAPARERDRLHGPSAGRPVGRHAADQGGQQHPRLRLTIAQGARAGPTDHAPARLRPPGRRVRLDLAKFKRLRDEGRPHEALALWRGPAYDDLAYEPCVRAERARLDELRLVTLEERIDADLTTGRHATWSASSRA